MVKLSHIAIAAPEIERVAARLKYLGLSVAEEHSVPSERVRAAMIPCEVSSHFRVELLEPSEENSPLTRFLEKKPTGGVHHLCFEVRGIEHWHTRLVNAGVEILPPGLRQGARGKVLFIHPRSMGGVLVELEEINASNS